MDLRCTKPLIVRENARSAGTQGGVAELPACRYSVGGGRLEGTRSGLTMPLWRRRTFALVGATDCSGFGPSGGMTSAHHTGANLGRVQQGLRSQVRIPLRHPGARRAQANPTV